MGSDGGEVGTTVGGKGETTVESQRDNMSEWLLKRYTMGRIDVFFAG